MRRADAVTAVKPATRLGARLPLAEVNGEGRGGVVILYRCRQRQERTMRRYPNWSIRHAIPCS